MLTKLDTIGVPPQKRLALWQDIVCNIFVQLDCKSDAGDAFQGSVTHADLGVMHCTNVTASRQRVFRTPARIAQAREDFVLIALGVKGEGLVVQDGREAFVSPGAFAIYDTTRPYELRFNGDFTQIILQVPRLQLTRRVGTTVNVTAMTFTPEHPLEKLTSEFLRGVSQLAGHVSPETACRLTSQGLDLLAVSMTERMANAAPCPSSHRAAMLLRIKAYIEAHLGDPDLSLVQTAAELGLSARYINELLSDDQTSFRRYLLARRLEQCRRCLASPKQSNLHINEIAFAWGFNDLAHFSRAFKQRFGMPPREWRYHAGSCRGQTASQAALQRH